eukprot:scaffold289150_cov22-Prasinocladus_malaysianus.AAC.1
MRRDCYVRRIHCKCERVEYYEYEREPPFRTCLSAPPQPPPSAIVAGARPWWPEVARWSEQPVFWLKFLPGPSDSPRMHSHRMDAPPPRGARAPKVQTTNPRCGFSGTLVVVI